MSTLSLPLSENMDRIVAIKRSVRVGDGPVTLERVAAVCDALKRLLSEADLTDAERDFLLDELETKGVVLANLEAQAQRERITGLRVVEETPAGEESSPPNRRGRAAAAAR
jgi:hypothetical protein